MSNSREKQVAPGEIQRKPRRLSRFVINIAMPLAALACAILITGHLIKTGPKANPSRKPPTAAVVEVQPISSGPQRTVVSGMGEIVAAKEIELKPQVNGEITDISAAFQPGGSFLIGDELVRLEKTDYELIIKQLKSDLAAAESELALEMGNQRIAEREFSLLGEEVSTEEKSLILRQPQLIKNKASRDDVLARLSQAELDLQRTVVKAPFNGVVAEKMVDIGAMVGETSPLARIVGTDAFWLKLTLPAEKLRWLKIPDAQSEDGSRVIIHPQGSTMSSPTRVGEVVRLLVSLEDQGRMAQLLIKVDDPLSLREENRGKPKLLLGSYVRAEVEGITIPSGFRIDRSHLRDGNTVWLMSDEGKLDIREVELIFRDQDSVIVSSGVVEGENLVVSPLSSPIAGTPLKMKDPQQSSSEKIADKKEITTGERRMSRVN